MEFDKIDDAVITAIEYQNALELRMSVVKNDNKYSVKSTHLITDKDNVVAQLMSVSYEDHWYKKTKKK